MQLHIQDLPQNLPVRTSVSQDIPIKTAVTEKKVTGASKKIIPETATGNLFNAPAILDDEYRFVRTRIPISCR